MTSYVVDSLTPTNSTFLLGLEENDSLDILDDGLLLTNGNSPVAILNVGSSVNIQTGGTLMADGSGYPTITSNAAFTTITVQDGGSITQFTDGIVSGSQIYINPVEFPDSVPAIYEGTYASITNFGSIASSTTDTTELISIYGTENVISNYGGITTYSIGPQSGTAIAIHDSDLGPVNANTNTIFNANGGYISAGGDYESGTAIRTASANDTVINNGFIFGVVSLGGGHDVFVNHMGASMFGHVEMGDGNDTFQASGSTYGTVYGGAGDDTYILADQNSTVFQEFADEGNDTVQTGSSFDLTGTNIENVVLTGTASAYAIGAEVANVLTGNGSANVLSGNGGNDVLSGGAGQDMLFGGADNDILSGQQSRDELYGGEGNDTLYGGQNHDTLFGGTGDDILSGGAGSDRIEGGEGRDILIGGAGRDVFVFTSLADSAIDDLGDVIRDFDTADDRIDLLAFSQDSSLGWLGQNDFTGTQGEVRYELTGRHTLVQVDADGDGAADLQFRLIGHQMLERNDFIF